MLKHKFFEKLSIIFITIFIIVLIVLLVVPKENIYSNIALSFIAKNYLFIFSLLLFCFFSFDFLSKILNPNIKFRNNLFKPVSIRIIGGLTISFFSLIFSLFNLKTDFPLHTERIDSKNNINSLFCKYENNEIEINKYDDEMLWEIKSKDKNGKLSYVYVYGLLNKDSLVYSDLSENLKEIIDKSDRIVGDSSYDDYKRLVDNPNFIHDILVGKESCPVDKYLNSDELEILKKSLGENSYERLVKINSIYPIVAMLESLTAKKVNYTLDKNFLIQEYIIKSGKTFEGLNRFEDLMNEVKMTDFEYEEQFAILKNEIERFNSGKMRDDLIASCNFYHKNNLNDLREFVDNNIQDCIKRLY